MTTNKSKTKTTATLWVFALSAALLCTVSLSNAEAQVVNSQPSLSIPTIQLDLQSPEAIARYMWKNFQFENDQMQFGREEYWQSPEELLKNRRGDCEDFALLAQQLLNNIGKKAFLLNIYGHKYAHTICVFMENGKYQVMDMTDVKRYNADSISELMSKVYPHWQSGAIVGMSKSTNQGRILKKIEKKAKIHRAFASAL